MQSRAKRRGRGHRTELHSDDVVQAGLSIGGRDALLAKTDDLLREHFQVLAGGKKERERSQEAKTELRKRSDVVPVKNQHSVGLHAQPLYNDHAQLCPPDIQTVFRLATVIWE